VAGRINDDMPYYVRRRLMDALNDQGKPLNGARILVLGVAYKADIDDMRESPAVDCITLIKEKGGQIVYHDPHVAEYVQDGQTVQSVDLTADEVRAADAVVILAGHSAVDYDMVCENASLVFDTRNVLTAEGDNIVAL